MSMASQHVALLCFGLTATVGFTIVLMLAYPEMWRGERVQEGMQKKNLDEV
jgi:hypothetical protein